MTVTAPSITPKRRSRPSFVWTKVRYHLHANHTLCSDVFRLRQGERDLVPPRHNLQATSEVPPEFRVL